MKSTISVKVNGKTKEVIKNYCNKNDILFSDWLKDALRDKLVKSKLVKP